VTYALVQALRALRSNWVASIATLTTMTVSLTILAGFSLVTLNLNQMLAALQGELEVTAYLDPDHQSAGVLDQVRAWPEVVWVRYIPKSQALAELVADLPSLGVAADLVDNPLPDTLRMRLLDPSQTVAVRGRLEGLDGISGVEDGSEAVKTFLAISAALRVVGLVLVVVLLASALFAIVNSIRAAIEARADEIEVQRLVGATQLFIRGPFMLEGLLLGLVSAAIALALVLPGYQLIIANLGPQLQFVPFVRDPLLVGQVAGLLVLLSVLVGLVGSAISVTHHLQERG
jgi:cell division transport system permease protein